MASQIDFKIHHELLTLEQNKALSGYQTHIERASEAMAAKNRYEASRHCLKAMQSILFSRRISDHRKLFLIKNALITRHEATKELFQYSWDPSR